MFANNVAIQAINGEVTRCLLSPSAANDMPAHHCCSILRTLICAVYDLASNRLCREILCHWWAWENRLEGLQGRPCWSAAAEVYALVVSGRCLKRREGRRTSGLSVKERDRGVELDVGEKWVVNWVGLRQWRCRAAMIVWGREWTLQGSLHL